MGTNELMFFVNGKKICQANPDPQMTLLQFLRRNLRLTGTKLGCAEGGCGACTVMVSTVKNREKKELRHFSINACLYPLCALHGTSVTTVEGIGSLRRGLHPVQERLSKAHGSQCGFCTPGFVMSMYTLLRNSPTPSNTELMTAFEGNLCRCTGYRPILEGFQTFVKCSLGDDCCQSGSDPKSGVSKGSGMEQSTSNEDQDVIFPPELLVASQYDQEEIHFFKDGVTWLRPVTLQRLLTMKREHPEAKLVVGNTELGIETKFKGQVYSTLIAPTHIEELLQVTVGQEQVSFGASVCLSNVRDTLKAVVDREPDFKTGSMKAIIEMLRWFAGQQIKNVASLGGNIMTASPISDLNPLWMASGAMLSFSSELGGKRVVPFDHQLFLGYRKLAVEKEEVLLSLSIPYLRENEYFQGYKQAHRKEDDIAIVNAGMRVRFGRAGEHAVVIEAALAFGGMSPVTVLAHTTAAKMIGRLWDESLKSDVMNSLAEELALPPGVPGGMAAYRNTLSLSFFFKFFLFVQYERQTPGTEVVSHKDMSALGKLHESVPQSQQMFENSSQRAALPVGEPMRHSSADKQVTGEAVYVDDLLHLQGEVQMALVLSTEAHANIVSVTATEALKLPGVVDYLDHTAIPGTNQIGIMGDEEFFASKTI